MSQTIAEDSEVLFDQPEESAGALEPEGSSRKPRQEGNGVRRDGTSPWSAAQEDGLRPTG